MSADMWPASNPDDLLTGSIRASVNEFGLTIGDDYDSCSVPNEDLVAFFEWLSEKMKRRADG